MTDLHEGILELFAEASRLGRPWRVHPQWPGERKITVQRAKARLRQIDRALKLARARRRERCTCGARSSGSLCVCPPVAVGPDVSLGESKMKGA